MGAGSSQRAGAAAGASAPPTPPQEQKQPCIRRGRFATGASGATAAGRACGAASEAAAKHKPAPQHQGGHHGGHQGGQQNQGRKKKKFFQKGSATAAQPGNSISAPPQGKRKAKQKGPREFVGPMDHSYRLVNGNIAAAPPSPTPTPMRGRRNYQAAKEPQPMAAVREDAPARIYCFIEDMFFLAKIQETARKLGVKVEFVKGGDKDSVAALADLPETERPKLLVFDLNNLNAKPLTLIPKFKSKLKKATSIVGFLNHL